MPCNGLAAENYDLFVLGILENDDRREMESHIGEQCAACLAGVRRSLLQWSVFAAGFPTGLAEAPRPSLNLRSRLVEMVKQTSKAVVSPDRLRKDGSRPIGRWWLQVAAAGIAVVVGMGAWLAGRQSGALVTQQLSAELVRAQSEVANTKIGLAAAVARAQRDEQALSAKGQGGAVTQQDAIRQQILQLQAEVLQYKTAVERSQRSLNDNVRLINTLSTAGTRLLPMKGAEIASAATAYSLIVENARIFLVASGLPTLPAGKQFQIWVIRKDDPKPVSIGLFNADENRRAVIEFQAAQDVSQLAAIAVTDEPVGGSPAPTGGKLLVGSPSE